MCLHGCATLPIGPRRPVDEGCCCVDGVTWTEIMRYVLLEHIHRLQRACEGK